MLSAEHPLPPLPTRAVGGLSDMVTFFFDNPADFREVVAFTYATGAEYNLQLKSLHGGFRQGLEALLESTSVKAILLGTRKWVHARGVSL